MTLREGAVALASAAFLAGCGPREVRPVEIYPEDMCALCRMAISDQRFASEIVEQNGTVHKFDDLGCLAQYRGRTKGLEVAAVFLKDYETGEWVPEARGTVVEAGVSTPMGSGRVAFGDPERARAFAAAHPKTEAEAKDPCCTPAAE